jgi:hypothetical protein
MLLGRHTDRAPARLTWSRHHPGAMVTIARGLSERDQLAAIRWAADTLIRRRHDAGELDGAHSMCPDAVHRDLLDLDVLEALSAPSEPPPAALDQIDTGERYSECLRCGHTFAPESSPRDELCWMCAELDDAESGVRDD